MKVGDIFTGRDQYGKMHVRRITKVYEGEELEQQKREVWPDPPGPGEGIDYVFDTEEVTTDEKGAA
jgi:hypothetical protein